MRLKHFLSVFLTLLTLSVGQMWGADPTVTLPFEWTVASDNSSAISYPTGVSQSNVGIYNSNAPYRLKFDGANDYIQINLDAAASVVYFNIKKIGGNANSKFKVQGCATSNGTYLDIQEFTISGDQNAIVNCTTTVSINSSYRYIRIIKSAHPSSGGNVGLGYVKITKAATAVNRTVAWMCNGSSWSSGVVAGNTTVASGSKISAVPTAPTSSNCDNSKVFVGWTANENYSNASTAPSDLFTDVEGSPAISADVTFYAVFATATTENVTIPASSKQYTADINYDQLVTGGYANNNGNHSSTATASDESTTTMNWTSNNVEQASSKLHFKSDAGYVYNTENLGTINSVSFSDNSSSFSVYTGTSANPSTTTTGGYFKVKANKVSGGPSVSKITVTFTKTIPASSQEVTTYSNYVTSCCSSLGSINGSVNLDQTSATLTWDKKDNAEWEVSYKVKGAQGDASTDNVGTIAAKQGDNTKLQCTISELAPGTNYEFYVYAVASGYCEEEKTWTLEGSTDPAFTITAESSNTSYGTVSISGTTITATLADYCRYATSAYTVVNGTATIEQGTGENVNKFTVTPTANCSIRINFEPIPVTGVTIKESTTEVSALSLEVGGSTALTAAVAPNTANPGVNWTVTQADNFISFNTSTGAVSALKAGTATITATSTLDNTKTASCTVTVVPVVEYKKITAALTDWSGEYLLIYEPGENKARVWTGVDVASCYVEVDIPESGKISKPNGAAKLNIASMENEGDYSIKIIGGDNNNKYLSNSSSDNKFSFGNAEAAYTLGFNGESGELEMSNNGRTIRYNPTNTAQSTQLRFRPYTSGQQPVQLYRKVVTSAVTITAPATGTGSLALANGQTAVTSGDNIDAGTELTVTATPSAQNHYIGGTIVVKKTSDQSDVTNEVLSGTTLTMPEYPITVSATFTLTYAITGASVEGGSFSWEETTGHTTPAYAAAGTQIQASANATDGYVFGGTFDIYKTADSDDKVSQTNGSFTMPAYAVTIGGSFNEAPTITLSQTSTMAFSKVATGASTSAKFTVSAANLTAGSLSVTKGGTNPDEFGLSVSSITVTAGSVSNAEVTVTPVTTATGDFTATITVDDGNGGAEAQSFDVTLHVEDDYTIQWYVNGTAEANMVKTQKAFANDDLDIPTASDLAPFTDCSEFIFLGWKDGSAIDGGSSTSAPTLANVGTKVAASKNYYAVFGDGSPEVDESDSWDLETASDDWTGSKTETYFTKPYGMKKENAYIVNNSISDFENYANDADEINITVTCFQNGGTTSRLTVYLVDENGAIITGTGKEFTPTNGSGVSSAADSEVTYSASDVKDKNATGYMVKCTTYDKGILITGTSYQITKAENYEKYYTTCPQIKNVVLSAATVDHGSISFKVGGKAATSARTDEDDVVVDIIASPETGYELTGISLSELSGASYNSTTGKIELEQNTNGTLTVTAEFTQKNYSVAVQTYPASIGAELTGTTSTAKYGVEQTISTNEPAGYIFRYWYIFDASTFDADNIDWDADLSEEIFTGTYEGEDFEMEASFEMQDKNLVAVAYFNRIYTPAQALELTNLDDSVFVEGIISQVDEVNVSNNYATYWISADGSTTNQLKIYKGKHLNKETITNDNKDEIAEGNRVIVRGKLSEYSNANQFGSGASYIKRLTEKELSALEIVGTPLNVYKPGDSFNKENLSLTATYNTGYIVENYTGTTISSNYDAPNTFSDLGSVDVTLSASETPSGAAEAVETSRVVTVTVTNAILDHVVIASSAKTSFWLNEQYKEPKLDAYMDDGETVNYNVTGTSNTTGLNMGTTGDKSVTVSYTLGETKSTTYNFTVNPIAVEEANAHSVATARDIIDVDNDENENLDLANAANKTHVIGKVTSVEALSGSKYTIVIKDLEDATKVMTLYKVTLKSGISSVVVNDVIKAYGNLYYHTSSNKYEINEGGQVVWKQPKVDIQIANKILEVGENWTIDATITPAAAPVTYSIKVGSDACITLDNDEISATAAGTATIIASAAEYSDGVNSYAANSKEFTVTVLSPAVHTSVVLLAEHNGTYYALNNSAGTTTVEMNSGMVVVANEATKNAIIWDCAERDGVATFYNEAANKYLQGGTTTTLGTQATTTAENYTQWTWVETATKAYYTANSGSSARSFIYQNGQGIKNYAVSNIGNSSYAQAKVLAKKVAIKVVPEGNDPVTKDEDDVPNNTSIVVSDKVTLEINNAKTLDNLTVEAGGSLELTAGENKKLTVNDMTIKSEAGKSGQVTGTNVKVDGDIYLEIKLCDGVMDAEASRKWYCISAPFDVNMNGGFFWADGTEMVLNTHFQMFEYQGEKRARTGNGWQRVSGTMKANTAYFIGFDDERIGNGAGMNQNTIKLKANANTIPTAEPMQLAGHSSEIEGSNDWYGLGNPALHYVGVNKTAHVFGYEVQGYDVVPSWSTDFTGFVVGTAFFVQGTGELSFNNAASAYHAPKRQAEEYTYCVEIAKEGASRYDNRVFVRASEDAESEFVQGKDEYTLNGTSSSYGALLWTENYGGKRLAIEEAPLVNGTASYVLTLSAPANGSYVISVAEAKDNADLYLTYEGSIIWNLSMGAYEIELNKGTTNGYGLLLQAKAPQVVTGVDEVDAETGVQKIIIDEHVFILRGGQLFGIDGKAVK